MVMIRDRDRRPKWLITALLLVALIAWDWYGSRFRLNAEDILAIKPGMTMNEVRSILGDPLDEEVRRGYDFCCRCNPEKICWQPERTTWIYTRKPLFRVIPFLTFPMLWVHFNSPGHLDEVYMKKYFAMGLDWRGIYLSKLDPCDPTDRTLQEFPPGYDVEKARTLVREIF